MGLDITAYSRLRYLTPHLGTEEDEEIIRDNDAVQLYNDSYYKRLGMPEGYYEVQGETQRIACGAYSHYNRWREELARLAGWPLGEYEKYGQKYPSHAATAWQAESGPFWELISYSDCGGAIGPAVSTKLAADFAHFRPSIAERAVMMGDDGYFMKKYDEWQAAFALASDNGAVEFH